MQSSRNVLTEQDHPNVIQFARDIFGNIVRKTLRVGQFPMDLMDVLCKEKYGLFRFGKQQEYVFLIVLTPEDLTSSMKGMTIIEPGVYCRKHGEKLRKMEDLFEFFEIATTAEEVTLDYEKRTKPRIEMSKENVKHMNFSNDFMKVKNSYATYSNILAIHGKARDNAIDVEFRISKDGNVILFEEKDQNGNVISSGEEQQLIPITKDINILRQFADFFSLEVLVKLVGDLSENEIRVRAYLENNHQQIREFFSDCFFAEILKETTSAVNVLLKVMVLLISKLNILNPLMKENSQFSEIVIPPSAQGEEGATIANILKNVQSILRGENGIWLNHLQVLESYKKWAEFGRKSSLLETIFNHPLPKTTETIILCIFINKQFAYPNPYNASIESSPVYMANRIFYDTIGFDLVPTYGSSIVPCYANYLKTQNHYIDTPKDLFYKPPNNAPIKQKSFAPITYEEGTYTLISPRTNQIYTSSSSKKNILSGNPGIIEVKGKKIDDLDLNTILGGLGDHLSSRVNYDAPYIVICIGAEVHQVKVLLEEIVNNLSLEGITDINAELFSLYLGKKFNQRQNLNLVSWEDLADEFLFSHFDQGGILSPIWGEKYIRTMGGLLEYFSESICALPKYLAEKYRNYPDKKKLDAELEIIYAPFPHLVRLGDNNFSSFFFLPKDKTYLQLLPENRAFKWPQNVYLKKYSIETNFSLFTETPLLTGEMLGTISGVYFESDIGTTCSISMKVNKSDLSVDSSYFGNPLRFLMNHQKKDGNLSLVIVNHANSYLVCAIIANEDIEAGSRLLLSDAN